MPAIIAAAAIGGGLNLIGAKLGSNAAKSAAKTQADAGAKAQQIQQQGQTQALKALDTNYVKAAGLYDPYKAIGQNALPSLTRLAGSNYPGAAMPQGPQSPMMPPQGAQAIYGAPRGAPQGGGMVTLRNPKDGSVRAFPPDVAAHYIQLGAVPVQ